MPNTSISSVSDVGAPTDLTWLLHRAAHRLRVALDEVARGNGLRGGVRDWIVLTALRGGPPRTQLALARTLGLDKTTLTSVLDRLEAEDLVVRALDPDDRRARIPEITERGQRLQGAIAAARDEAETDLLASFSEHEQRLLRSLLARLAEDPAHPGEVSDGSCM